MKNNIRIAIYLLLLLTTTLIPSSKLHSKPQIAILPVTAPTLTQLAPRHMDSVGSFVLADTIEPSTTVDNVVQDATSSGVVSSCVTGYSTGDYYLDQIITFESHGNTCATNSGGCFGLLQACPGEPLREACGGDPACQIAWFQANKTGGRTWAEVWQHELDWGWW